MKINSKKHIVIGSAYRVDPIGAIYCANYSKQKGLEEFSMTWHLHTPVDANALRKSVDDLVIRLPFLSSKLKKGFFHYKHIVSDKPIPINQLDSDSLLRVYYSNSSFTLTVMHSLCDGRGLLKIAVALVVRYFEVLSGKKIDKGDIIDCEDKFCFSEMEDAYRRVAKTKRSVFGKNKRSWPRSYRSTLATSSAPPKKLYVYNFELDRLKKIAKRYGATVNEYILARIFECIRDERDNDSLDKKQKVKPISASVPFDLRAFFDSKTHRTFTSAPQVVMAENADTIEIVSSIKQQIKATDSDFLLADIKQLLHLCKAFFIVPRFIKKPILKRLASTFSNMLSVSLSNIGLAKLPQEVESQIKNIEVIQDCYPHTPFTFVCASIGNVCTLTLCNAVSDKVFDRLNDRIMC